MRVAVVMPVNNAAKTLAAAIESIISQSFRDWQMLVYDDGSTDATPRISAEIAKKDPRIRLIQAPHAGIVEALRNACDAVPAEAAYIARMDADDIAHPTRLERQSALMESDHRIGLCGTGVRMTGAVGSGRRRYERWVNSVTTHEDIVRDLFVECPIPHPTFLMRRDAYIEAGGYRDFGWAEDYDLVFRLFLKGSRFAKVAEPLLDWTESPNRLSMTANRYSDSEFRKAKRHYLFQSFLKNGRDFYQWGAGEVGKKWLREWDDRRPQAVVDINPRKIGKKIHATTVVPPEALPQPGAAFIVVAVGAPGARAEIRDWFQLRGYMEGGDFIFLA